MPENMTFAAIIAMYVMIACFFATEFYRDAESVDNTPSWTYILFWLCAATWPVVAMLIFAFAVFSYMHSVFKMNALVANLKRKEKSETTKGD